MHFEAEIPLISPNRLRAEHWRSRAWRVKCERAEIARVLAGVGTPPPGPWIVTVVRLGPRELDAHDNLGTSAKGVVDEIAAWLGLGSDRDPRVTWRYAQEKRLEPARPTRTPTGRERPAKGKHRVWVRVEVETRPDGGEGQNRTSVPVSVAPGAGLGRVCADCGVEVGQHLLIGKSMRCPTIVT
jgi:hypothetical protein